MMERLLYISQAPHLENIRAACAAGCKWIQLRAKKNITDALATEAKEICNRYGALLTVNDDVAVAMNIRAYGIHVGKQDMPVANVRRLAGKDYRVGGTANTLPDILMHVDAGADYIGLGPYRFTTTKQNLSPILGLEGYRQIMRQLGQMNIHIPVLAIGGIFLEDIPGLMEAGVYGVAMSGQITHATDKSQIVRELHKAIFNNL